jgi:hypothetical protein
VDEVVYGDSILWGVVHLSAVAAWNLAPLICLVAAALLCKAPSTWAWVSLLGAVLTILGHSVMVLSDGIMSINLGVPQPVVEQNLIEYVLFRYGKVFGLFAFISGVLGHLVVKRPQRDVPGP